MKKLFTLAVVGCCLTGAAQAQLVGVEGGVSFNNLRMDWDDVDVETNTRTNIRLGAFADIPIGRGASFQPGIYYAPKGSELELNSEFFDGGVLYREKIEQRIKINYLEIPMNFQFKLNPVRRSGFFFGAGPYVAFALDGEIDYEETLRNTQTGLIEYNYDDEYDLEIGDDELEDDVKGTDWGINLNLGYVGMGGLFIRGNAGIGLSNIIPGEDDDLSAKNLSLALTLGYVFGRR